MFWRKVKSIYKWKLLYIKRQRPLTEGTKNQKSRIDTEQIRQMLNNFEF